MRVRVHARTDILYYQPNRIRVVMVRVLVVDGYIDDPAALGVPPYISPMIRAVAGAAMDAGAEVEYLTVDMVRGGADVPDADVSVVLSGSTVPGKYIRSMPMSLKELRVLVPRLKGWRMLGGSASGTPEAELFDFSVRKDLAASLYDGLIGKEVGERLRTLDEWNRWMLLGADIVREHQDFPVPLVAEIESYRGCHRYASGGCSYCVEPLKGRPLMREPEDIIAEASRLRELGVKNIRVGGQTCIISYGSLDTDDPPRPVPEKVDALFTGLSELGFDVLHTDNANPAVISHYPEESERILNILAEKCTPGNVLALGMESADPRVIRENNLNSTPEDVLNAVRMINRIGAVRGDNGMPRLLPGLNIIAGLDGETSATYDMDMDILRRIMDEGLMVRRINIRQVLPVRRGFDVRIDQRRFRRFKEDVRDEIDHGMLRRLVPEGTVLRNVYMELRDGNLTFGRQIGSYPLLVGVPYPLGTESFRDIIITGWGQRSVTGIEYPFPIATASLAALAALPGVGKKRAARLANARPSSPAELRSVIEDDVVAEALSSYCKFDE